MHPHVAEPSIVTLTAIEETAREHSASCAAELADLHLDLEHGPDRQSHASWRCV